MKYDVVSCEYNASLRYTGKGCTITTTSPRFDTLSELEEYIDTHRTTNMFKVELSLVYYTIYEYEKRELYSMNC